MSILKTPYAHLLPEDSVVWARWLQRYGDLFQSVEYDIQVGKGRDPGAHHPANLRAMGIKLSRRRIDAVCFRPGEIHLVEITRIADLRCLGQVAAYPALYRETYQPRLQLKMAVVAEELGTDMQLPFRQANVTIYLV